MHVILLCSGPYVSRLMSSLSFSVVLVDYKNSFKMTVRWGLKNSVVRVTFSHHEDH